MDWRGGMAAVSLPAGGAVLGYFCGPDAWDLAADYCGRAFAAVPGCTRLYVVLWLFPEAREGAPETFRWRAEPGPYGRPWMTAVGRSGESTEGELINHEP